MLKINSAIMDLFYPVGTYYETSNVDFDPNVAWGGTWVLDSQGKVTVSQDTTDSDFDTLGETGGSKYLQQHQHNGLAWEGVQSESISLNNGSSPGYSLTFQGGIVSGQEQLIQTYPAGTGDSGNLQPYVVVKRWHRTA